MGVAAALADATRVLTGVSDTPRLDAELLLAHALEVDRGALLLDPARFAVPPGYAALVERRRRHEPVAYITGEADFWTIRLKVGPGVLIPRSDSETLIEAAQEAFGTGGPASIIDLGTGPGTLLLAALALWPGASGIGIDASAIALDYARANAAQLGMEGRARFMLGDWAGAEQAELILTNPPYVASSAALAPQVADFEPAEALYAGADGLDDYRRLFPAIADRLLPGGTAIVEIGFDQRVAATALAIESGLDAVCRQDLAGRDRALICRHRVDLA